VAHGTPTEHRGAWREGQVYIDDASLAAAVAEINRYSRTKLILADPSSVGHMTISAGPFPTTDAAEFMASSLHELRDTYHLEARREPGKIVLYRRVE
jgi:ferric-dicitrate binding protein FerR (iron transport regulator)